MELVIIACVAIFSPVLFLTSLVVIANLATAPRLLKKEDSHKVTARKKIHITVCVPARDEEENIGNCIESLLAQDYPDYNILVLDDQSRDKTGAIIDVYAQSNPRLKKITGTALPPGWTGKNRACHILSKRATGTLLLFVDADCILAPHALSTASTVMLENGLGLLSSFPTQITVTAGEKLVVPIMNWILLTFLPLRLVYLSSWLSFTAANGQFMLFDRHAYEAIGGHESVHDRVVEDMELGRLIKRHRFRMMTALGGDTVFCRMYRSLRDGFSGFSKNFFPGFNTSVLSFSLLLVFIALFYLGPWLLPLVHPALVYFPLLVTLQRTGIALMGREQSPLYSVITQPVQMGIAVILGVYSIIITKRKSITWKGRTISAG